MYPKRKKKNIYIYIYIYSGIKLSIVKNIVVPNFTQAMGSSSKRQYRGSMKQISLTKYQKLMSSWQEIVVLKVPIKNANS